MQTSHNLYELPENISVPVDDGACDHLAGMRLSSVALISTSGRVVDLSRLPGRVVRYCYPRTGRRDVELPSGWNEIPGARGCTPRACAFRDHYRELQILGAQVFGLSTQDTAYQREALKRLHLPFELLSDAALEFTQQLQLPTFQVEGMTFIKRLTLIAHDGVIEKFSIRYFRPIETQNLF